MGKFICLICGTCFPPSTQPPQVCQLCAGKQQLVLGEGTDWTTEEELIQNDFHNVMNFEEHNLWSIRVRPSFASSQRAFFFHSDRGNVLWDCLSLLDKETVEKLEDLGGIHTIILSNPHFQTGVCKWAERFDAEVIVHESDVEFLVEQPRRLKTWTGEYYQLQDEFKLVRIGGSFPGSSVLVWQAGAEGKGCMFTGDTLFVTKDQCWISFLDSNQHVVWKISEIQELGQKLSAYVFDRIYGAWPNRTIDSNGNEVVSQSVKRVVNLTSVLKAKREQKVGE